VSCLIVTGRGNRTADADHQWWRWHSTNAPHSPPHGWYGLPWCRPCLGPWQLIAGDYNFVIVVLGCISGYALSFFMQGFALDLSGSCPWGVKPHFSASGSWRSTPYNYPPSNYEFVVRGSWISIWPQTQRHYFSVLYSGTLSNFPTFSSFKTNLIMSRVISCANLPHKFYLLWQNISIMTLSWPPMDRGHSSTLNRHRYTLLNYYTGWAHLS
jgi:hypothetical protein